MNSTVVSLEMISENGEKKYSTHLVDKSIIEGLEQNQIYDHLRSSGSLNGIDINDKVNLLVSHIENDPIKFSESSIVRLDITFSYPSGFVTNYGYLRKNDPRLEDKDLFKYPEGQRTSCHFFRSDDPRLKYSDKDLVSEVLRTTNDADYKSFLKIPGIELISVKRNYDGGKSK